MAIRENSGNRYELKSSKKLQCETLCLQIVSRCNGLKICESADCVWLGMRWRTVPRRWYHAESVRCHACHAVDVNRQDSYTVSADRHTDLGTAVYAYMCECSICSTVKEQTAVSWAGHKYRSQSVKDDPGSYCRFTWCGSYPSKRPFRFVLHVQYVIMKSFQHKYWFKSEK